MTRKSLKIGSNKPHPLSNIHQVDQATNQPTNKPNPLTQAKRAPNDWWLTTTITTTTHPFTHIRTNALRIDERERKKPNRWMMAFSRLVSPFLFCFLFVSFRSGSDSCLLFLAIAIFRCFFYLFLTFRRWFDFFASFPVLHHSCFLSLHPSTAFDIFCGLVSRSKLLQCALDHFFNWQLAFQMLVFDRNHQFGCWKCVEMKWTPEINPFHIQMWHDLSERNIYFSWH